MIKPLRRPMAIEQHDDDDRHGLQQIDQEPADRHSFTDWAWFDTTWMIHAERDLGFELGEPGRRCASPMFTTLPPDLVEMPSSDRRRLPSNRIRLLGRFQVVAADRPPRPADRPAGSSPRPRLLTSRSPNSCSRLELTGGMDTQDARRIDLDPPRPRREVLGGQREVDVLRLRSRSGTSAGGPSPGRRPAVGRRRAGST